MFQCLFWTVQLFEKEVQYFLSFKELGKICLASMADMNENPQESCFLLLHGKKEMIWSRWQEKSCLV